MNIDQLLAYYDDLKAEKQPYETLYQECYDFTVPDRDSFTRLYGTGERGNRHIFDHTAEYSVDVMASSLIGIMANPATRWVIVEMVDEKLNRDVGIAKWCEEAGQVLLNHVNRAPAGFYKALKASLVDMVIVGMPSAFVEETFPQGFRFTCLPPSRVYFAENADNQIDTVFYCYKLSVKQLYEKSQDKSNPWEIAEGVKEKFNAGKLTDMVEVIKVVQPRYNRKEDSITAKDMPFACYYIDKSHRKIMYEGGYQEMPIAVGRWAVKTGEKYPRSPVSSIIGEIKNLNVARRDLLVAVEKANEPAVWLPNDSNPQTVNFSSRGVNYYDAAKGNPVFESGIKDIKSLFTLVQELQSSVRTMLYNDQLQMVGTQQMTATEVMQRVDERARLIAPNIGAIATDFLAVMLERCLRILIRQGVVAPPPQEIAGKEFRINFSTPLMRAQRGQDAVNMQAALQGVGLLVQLTQSPEPLDNIDTDAVTKELMDIHGVTGLVMRDEQERDEMRQARAEAQQQQAQMEQANLMADTANKAGLVQKQ